MFTFSLVNAFIKAFTSSPCLRKHKRLQILPHLWPAPACEGRPRRGKKSRFSLLLAPCFPPLIDSLHPPNCSFFSPFVIWPHTAFPRPAQILLLGLCCPTHHRPACTKDFCIAPCQAVPCPALCGAFLSGPLQDCNGVQFVHVRLGFMLCFKF